MKFITSLSVGALVLVAGEEKCAADASEPLATVASTVRSTYFKAVHGSDRGALAEGWHPEAHLRSSWPHVAFYQFTGQDPATWPGDYVNPDWDAAFFSNIVHNDPPCVDYFTNGDGVTPTRGGEVHETETAAFTCTAPDIFFSLQQMSKDTAMVKALIAAQGYYYTDMLTLGLLGGKWAIMTKSTTEQGPTVKSPFWVERPATPFDPASTESDYAEGSGLSFADITGVAVKYLTAVHAKDEAVLTGLMEDKSGMYSVVDDALKVELKAAYITGLPAPDTSRKAKQFDKIIAIEKNSMRASIATVQFMLEGVVYNENLSVYDFGENGLPTNSQARDWKIASITRGVAIDGMANKNNMKDAGAGKHLHVQF